MSCKTTQAASSKSKGDLVPTHEGRFSPSSIKINLLFWKWSNMALKHIYTEIIFLN